MPATLIMLLLLLSASGGWLIAVILTNSAFYPLKEKKLAGIRIQGIIPANQQQLADAIASSITNSFLKEGHILQRISAPGIMERLKPEIETHVDVFLQEKIQEAFPLLYKFMGDKTLAKFKAAFMTEVEVLFPVLLQNYVRVALEEMKPEQLISKQINAIPVSDMARAFEQKAGKQLTQIKLLGAAIGLLAGILQVFFILLLKK